MLINYKVDTITLTCYTNCPNGFKSKVGSVSCKECKYFIKDNTRTDVLDCSYDIENKIN